MDKESLISRLKELRERARQEGNTPSFNADKFRELVERIKAKREGKL